MIAPDTKAAMAFLSGRPHRTHNLVAIDPDRGAVVGITRPNGHVELCGFVERYSARRWNLYFSLNEPRPDAPDDPLGKEDIARIISVWADVDPVGDEGFAAGRLHAQATIQALGAHEGCPPSLIIDSGGGFWAVWDLIEPLPVEAATLSWAEAQGLGLAKGLDADHVQNIDRIARLPGTVNWPNAKKRAKGRAPALTRLVSSTGYRYGTEDITSVAPPAQPKASDGDWRDAPIDYGEAFSYLDLADLPHGLRRRVLEARKQRPKLDALLAGDISVIEQGGDRSRSGQLFNLVEELRAADFTATETSTIAVAAPIAYHGAWRGDDDDMRKLGRAWINSTSRGASEDFGSAPTHRFNFMRPVTFKDPAAIPPREFLYGRHLIRGFVSATVAPGGTGKSGLKVSEALTMAAGLPLLGLEPKGPLRVFYWNGEDDTDELDRRFAAAMRLLNVQPAQVAGRLFYGSGRDEGGALSVMKLGDRGPKAQPAVIDELKRVILEKRIDVAIFDPFISVHEVPENDNSSIDKVVKSVFGQIAHDCRCAVELVHHTRKNGGAENTVEDARGGKALVDATRSTIVLNRMTKDEAARWNVPEDRRGFYFRADDGKQNLAPPGAARWFELSGVRLPNGDEVGAVHRWAPPVVAEAARDEFGREQIAEALGDRPWRYAHQSPEWVGFKIIEALGLEPTGKAYAKRIVDELVRDGFLERFEEQDDRRKMVPWVRVANKAAPVLQ
jgi:hypothetical protein